jgi:hypothetical protein
MKLMGHQSCRELSIQLLLLGRDVALWQGKTQDGLSLWRCCSVLLKGYLITSIVRRHNVGGEAAVRALVEAGGQRSADGPPASPRPGSFKLSLLQRRQLRMIGQQRSGPARMIVGLQSSLQLHWYVAGGAGDIKRQKWSF